MNIYKYHKCADDLWNIIGSFGEFDTSVKFEDDLFSSENESIRGEDNSSNGNLMLKTAIVPKEGDVIIDIQRSVDSEYIYLCGSTTKQGYVGYENGILIILKKTDDTYKEIARYICKNKDRYYIEIEALDALTGTGHSNCQHRGNGRLTDTALTRGNGDDVLHVGQHFKRTLHGVSDNLLFDFNRGFNARRLQSGLHIALDRLQHVSSRITQFDLDDFLLFIDLSHTGSHIVDAHPRVDHRLQCCEHTFFVTHRKFPIYS